MTPLREANHHSHFSSPPTERLKDQQTIARSGCELNKCDIAHTGNHFFLRVVHLGTFVSNCTSCCKNAPPRCVRSSDAEHFENNAHHQFPSGSQPLGVSGNAAALTFALSPNEA